MVQSLICNKLLYQQRQPISQNISEEANCPDNGRRKNYFKIPPESLKNDKNKNKMEWKNWKTETGNENKLTN